MTKRTVLVVDDSPTIRKIMEKEIRPANYNVLTAASGEEALAMLQEVDPLPDLITLDIEMPGLDGFEVCQSIQQGGLQTDLRKQEIARIPIILVSAGDSLESREKGYALGIVNFMSKPFANGDILRTIQGILDASEQFTGMSALIVDDSPLTRRIIRKILNRHGLTIHEAARGEEALAMIKEQPDKIDIVITDYLMPGISGEEFCRKCRQLPEMERVPVFFISAIDRKSTVLSFFHAGANDYLPKPFIEEEFRARVLPHIRNRLYLKELSALNSRLRDMAERDALTHLFNRGYLEREGRALFSHAQITAQPLIFILLDLDFFKEINDNLGHAFGDLVIKEFAKILQEFVGARGITARFGGEEFVILLPGISAEEGLDMAERIRQHAGQHIYSNGETELSETCSIGIASYLDHKPETFDRFYSMADTALYCAKEEGRNQVRFFSWEMQR